ncbi:tyrosine-type recombinase/integrase [Vibrio mediterranei]
MRTVKLTQAIIQSYRPSSRTYTVWDSLTPMLGVRVCRDGRCFYVMRTAKGNQTVASTEQIKLKAAREYVEQTFRTVLKQGTRQSGQMIRFDALVKNEWTEKVMQGWKPATQGTARSALHCYLFEAFGRYPIHRIDSIHVQRWFDALSQKYAGAANRNLDVLRSIFAYAVKQGYCVDNPCDGVKQNRQRKLNRFLSHDELSKLDSALQAVSEVGEVEACCCQALRLVLLTGCRISEVTGLQWSFVKGSEWHLPDSKTGAKIVYVGEAAQRQVSQLRKEYAGYQSEDVFPLLSGFASKPTKVHTVWVQVRTLAEIKGVRIHDLRHTFASYAVLEGYPIPMVAKLLGHKRISSTLRYTHVGDAYLETEVQKIGWVIDDILNDKASNKTKKKIDGNNSISEVMTGKIHRKRAKQPRKETKVRFTETESQIQRYRDELDFLEWM